MEPRRERSASNAGSGGGLMRQVARNPDLMADTKRDVAAKMIFSAWKTRKQAKTEGMSSIQTHFRVNRSIRDTVSPFVKEPLVAENKLQRHQAYGRMTDVGRMWGLEAFDAPTRHDHGEHKVERLSQNHLEQAFQSLGDLSEEERGFLQRTQELAPDMRLRHYLPSNRAETVLSGDQRLMSLHGLERRGEGDVKNNTEEFDRKVLGNDDFVFFYMEHKDAGFRKSRFTKGDDPSAVPTRFTLDLAQASRQGGWMMKHDFGSQETPNLKSDVETDASQSKRQSIIGRLRHSPEYKPLVTRDANPDAHIEALTHKPEELHGDQWGTAAYNFVAQSNVATFNYPTTGESHTSPLSDNVLTARSMLTGLGIDAVHRMRRMGSDNTEVKRMLSSGGRDLANVLTRDLNRPQVMIPRQVKVERSMLERQEP